jgi:hypothetical protein
MVRLGVERNGPEAQAIEFAVGVIKNGEMTNQDLPTAYVTFRLLVDTAQKALDNGEFVPIDHRAEMETADELFPLPAGPHDPY